MAINGLAASRYIGNSPQYGFFDKQSLTTDSATTVFTLDFSVISASSIIVVLNSVILEPGVDYSIITSGTQISFTTAPTTGLSLYIIFLGQVLMLPTAVAYVAGSINPPDINANYSKTLYRSQIINATQNIFAQYVYYIDSTAGAFTVALPSTPTFGDKIILIDLNKTFTTNALTINRNTKNINSVAANYIARINGSKITLEFINNTIGWKLTLETYQNPQDAKLFFLAS